MQVSILVTILVALAALLIGWGIGFADSNRNTAKKIRSAETRAEIAIKEAQDKIADAGTRLQAVAQTAPDDPGLLRLKNENGGLALELDGQMIPTPNLTPDQKKRLIGLLTLIRPWLEGQSPQQPAPRAERAAPVPPPPTPVPVAAASPAPEPKTEPKPLMSTLSIVEQIDSILQSRMTNTPFAKQSIRLQESREGGVQVIVGINKYATVDDVPDPQVKAIIRAAIAEWEEKYTPGL